MAQKQYKLKINGMHCTSCSLLIDGDLEDTEGVVSATTHYAKQETRVAFEEEKITLDKIIEVVRNAGYEASVIEP